MPSMFHACTSLTLLALSVSSFAAPINSISESGNDLEIVVTASRLSSPLHSIAAPITKIDRADIDRWEPDSLAAVLSRVPGLSFQSSGGRGQVQTPSIRGSGSKGLLLVVDGIPVRDLANGGADYSNLDPNLIESIEVYRGSRSSLYGPNAAGGIIYVTTRQPQSDKGATLSFMGGNHQTEDYSAHITLTSSEKFNVGFSGSHYKTEGHDVTLTDFNPIDADHDGYWNTGGSFHTSISSSTLTNKTTATVSRSSAEYDESSTSATAQNPFIEREQTVLSNTTTWTPDKLYKMDISFGQSEDTFSPQDSFPSDTENQLDFINWNHYLMFGSGINLMLGGDYQRGELKSTSSFAPEDKKHENWAGYAELKSRINNSELSGSIRHDANSDYGTAKTGGIGLGQHLSPEHFIYSNYSTAFIAPSLSQLVNSPDLESEKSRSTDLGYRYTHDKIQLHAVAFYSKYYDKIVTDYSTFPATSDNIDHAAVKGVELEANYINQSFSTTASFTSQESYDQDEQRLIRTPHLFGSLDVDFFINKWAVGGRLYAQSHTEDIFYNPLTFSSSRVNLAGFATMDARATYKIHPSVKLKFDVKNIFDQIFSTTANYQEQRLTMVAGFEVDI